MNKNFINWENIFNFSFSHPEIQLYIAHIEGIDQDHFLQGIDNNITGLHSYYFHQSQKVISIALSNKQDQVTIELLFGNFIRSAFMRWHKC